MHCSNCGKENPEETKFCVCCGVDLFAPKEYEIKYTGICKCPNCGERFFVLFYVTKDDHTKGYPTECPFCGILFDNDTKLKLVHGSVERRIFDKTKDGIGE